MGGNEVGMIALYVTSGLAEYLEVADHRILRHLVLQKARFIHIVGVALNALNGLKNVREVVRETLWIVAHTGTASASTASRNLSGNAFGVSTSTGTPSSARNS